MDKEQNTPITENKDTAHPDDIGAEVIEPNSEEVINSQNEEHTVAENELTEVAETETPPKQSTVLSGSNDVYIPITEDETEKTMAKHLNELERKMLELKHEMEVLKAQKDAITKAMNRNGIVNRLFGNWLISPIKSLFRNIKRMLGLKIKEPKLDAEKEIVKLEDKIYEASCKIGDLKEEEKAFKKENNIQVVSERRAQQMRKKESQEQDNAEHDSAVTIPQAADEKPQAQIENFHRKLSHIGQEYEFSLLEATGGTLTYGIHIQGDPAEKAGDEVLGNDPIAILRYAPQTGCCEIVPTGANELSEQHKTNILERVLVAHTLSLTSDTPLFNAEDAQDILVALNNNDVQTHSVNLDIGQLNLQITMDEQQGIMVVEGKNGEFSVSSAEAIDTCDAQRLSQMINEVHGKYANAKYQEYSNEGFGEYMNEMNITQANRNYTITFDGQDANYIYATAYLSTESDSTKVTAPLRLKKEDLSVSYISNEEGKVEHGSALYNVLQQSKRELQNRYIHFSTQENAIKPEELVTEAAIENTLSTLIDKAKGNSEFNGHRTIGGCTINVKSSAQNQESGTVQVTISSAFNKDKTGIVQTIYSAQDIKTVAKTIAEISAQELEAQSRKIENQKAHYTYNDDHAIEEDDRNV